MSKLDSIRKSALKYLEENPRTQAKYLAKANNIDRSVALDILKEFVRKNLASMSELTPQNLGIRGTYEFTLASYITKEDMIQSFEARRLEEIKPINKAKLKLFVQGTLDETGKKACSYLCDHPLSTADDILKNTDIEVLQKSLHDKLSRHAKKDGLLDTKVILRDKRKIIHFSISSAIPVSLFREAISQKIVANDQNRKESSPTKTSQTLSAQEYFGKLDRLTSYQQKIIKLEIDIKERQSALEVAKEEAEALAQEISSIDERAKEHILLISRNFGIQN